MANATIQHGQNTQVVTGTGNGRLDAVSNAIKNYFNVSYELSFYEEHSLTKEVLQRQLHMLVLFAMEDVIGVLELTTISLRLQLRR